MSQDLNKIFKQIQKESESMGIAAMEDAANKAYKLAVEKAKSCLKTYYSKKPRHYKRTNTLRKAIIPYSPEKKDMGNRCIISFQIKYDSSRIKGQYKSNSWYHQSGDKWISRFDDAGNFKFDQQSNGIPDSGWILDNYLKGVHPGWYNGHDYGWKDQENTDNVMTQFFEKDLFEKAGELIYESMSNAVVDFIKKNGGGN